MTQNYADFSGQMEAFIGGKPLSKSQFEKGKRQVLETILRGVTKV